MQCCAVVLHYCDMLSVFVLCAMLGYVTLYYNGKVLYICTSRVPSAGVAIEPLW